MKNRLIKKISSSSKLWQKKVSRLQKYIGSGKNTKFFVSTSRSDSLQSVQISFDVPNGIRCRPFTEEEYNTIKELNMGYEENVFIFSSSAKIKSRKDYQQSDLRKDLKKIQQIFNMKDETFSGIVQLSARDFLNADDASMEMLFLVLGRLSSGNQYKQRQVLIELGYDGFSGLDVYSHRIHEEDIFIFNPESIKPVDKISPEPDADKIIVNDLDKENQKFEEWNNQQDLKNEIAEHEIDSYKQEEDKNKYFSEFSKRFVRSLKRHFVDNFENDSDDALLSENLKHRFTKTDSALGCKEIYKQIILSDIDPLDLTNRYPSSNFDRIFMTLISSSDFTNEMFASFVRNNYTFMTKYLNVFLSICKNVEKIKILISRIKSNKQNVDEFLQSTGFQQLNKEHQEKIKKLLK